MPGVWENASHTLAYSNLALNCDLPSALPAFVQPHPSTVEERTSLGQFLRLAYSLLNNYHSKTGPVSALSRTFSARQSRAPGNISLLNKALLLSSGKEGRSPITLWKSQMPKNWIINNIMCININQMLPGEHKIVIALDPVIVAHELTQMPKISVWVVVLNCHC